MERFTLDEAGLDALIAELRHEGYRVLGPVLADGAVRFVEIESVTDLPRGVGDRQAPGAYRTVASDDPGLFGFAVGPSSLKQTLFPPRRTLWEATLGEDRIEFHPVKPDPQPVAVIGARACDLAAAAVQDRVFLDGPFLDADYAARRQSLFVVAVECTRSASTCFCASVGTGPAATSGFDLALTELVEDGRHVFVGKVGSAEGNRIIERIPTAPATTDDIEYARHLVDGAARTQERSLDPTTVPGLLRRNLTHPRWAEVAERCLACGNCTQACPTCFCVTTEEELTLDGSHAAKHRRWDSCFTLDFSFMGGRSVRSSIDARYRQWLTHKLSSWVDQFGVLGCVGCGRCITWCPVGIDLTEEVGAIAATEPAHA